MRSCSDLTVWGQEPERGCALTGDTLAKVTLGFSPASLKVGNPEAGGGSCLLAVRNAPRLSTTGKIWFLTGTPGPPAPLLTASINSTLFSVREPGSSLGSFHMVLAGMTTFPSSARDPCLANQSTGSSVPSLAEREHVTQTNPMTTCLGVCKEERPSAPPSHLVN